LVFVSCVVGFKLLRGRFFLSILEFCRSSCQPPFQSQKFEVSIFSPHDTLVRSIMCQSFVCCSHVIIGNNIRKCTLDPSPNSLSFGLHVFFVNNMSSPCCIPMWHRGFSGNSNVGEPSLSYLRNQLLQLDKQVTNLQYSQVKYNEAKDKEIQIIL